MAVMYDFALLTVTNDAGVLTAVIDNPPINLITPELFKELAGFAATAAARHSSVSKCPCHASKQSRAEAMRPEVVATFFGMVTLVPLTCSRLCARRQIHCLSIPPSPSHSPISYNTKWQC